MEEEGEELPGPERLTGELLAMKAVMRWLVARELARSPDPHRSAERLETELQEAIDLARLAHTEEAIRSASAAMQTMMALIDLPAPQERPDPLPLEAPARHRR